MSGLLFLRIAVEVTEVTMDIPALLGVYVPQNEFLNQERSILRAKHSSDPGEGWEETALQETVLMDFSGPHHLHKYFRQKMPCAFDIILGLWVYNSMYCAYSMCCVQATPSLRWGRCPLFFEWLNLCSTSHCQREDIYITLHFIDYFLHAKG